ncbi:MAG: SwmB domain-containing protein [bacterium]|nr:SwmB domain-containing protein [bacterium]
MRLVGFQADAEGDWKAVSPALPDPFVTTVTLTATDPDGLSASVTGDFRTDWESHPALLGARSGGDDIELTFDQAVQPAPVPAPGQFAVNVVNTDGSSGTVAVSSVAVSGAVITLELDSTLESAQTVTLDYSHADDAPLKRAADGGDHAPGFTGQAVELIELPGPPANFEVSAEPGELGLSATWDAAEGATSYKLAWRQADGDFRPDDETTVTDTEVTVPVSGHGRWAVRLQGCNRAGCGPEVAATAEVGSIRFDLSQARDGAGNLRPRTFNASWSRVPGASAYGLSWRRVAEANPQAQAQNRGASAQGSRGTSGPGADSQGENRLDLPGDQTSAEFTVPEMGTFEVILEVYVPQSDEPIALPHGHVTAWVTNPGNVTLFHQFECATQPGKITGVWGQALHGGVRINWNTPATAIDGYQYQLQEGNGFVLGRDGWTDIDPDVAAPRPRKLVGNTGQTNNLARVLDQDYAQSFDTGPNNAGYTLTAVDIHMSIGSRQGRAPDFTVDVYSAVGAGPHARMGRLTAPSFLRNGINTFTAPGAGIRLERRTVYFLVVTVADGGDWNVQIRLTTSQAEDSDGEQGWKVADRHFYGDHGETTWEYRENQSLRVGYHGYAERSGRHGYLQHRARDGTTSFTLKGLENGSSYGILLRGVAGSGTRCFQKLIFVTPFQRSIPTITGFDAFKGYRTGPRQATLVWDDPDDPTLTYEYWYMGVPAHWSGWPGRGGWFRVEGSAPEPTRDGKLRTVVSGLPCENYFYHFRIRPSRGNVPGTSADKAYVYLAYHGTNGDSVLRGDDGGDCLLGWGGDDKLYGNGGYDILYGGDGNDKLHGGDGNDKLHGHGGDDRLYGNAGRRPAERRLRRGQAGRRDGLGLGGLLRVRRCGNRQPRLDCRTERR